MNTFLELFLSFWLYLILGNGILNGVFLYRNRKTWSLQRKLTSLAVIILVLHVWEEWRIPGGFFYLYNQGSYCYPMNQLTDMLTNLIGIVLGSIVALAWGGNTVSSIAVMFISLFEIVVHCGILMLRTQGLFEGTGVSVYYDPGMVTALLGFLPVTIGFLYSFVKQRPRWKEWVFGIIALLIVIQTNVILPEEIFKDEETPYAFTDKGYYAQFDVTFPNDPSEGTETEEGL